ncbi:FecR family protein [Pedobacter hiemivivus]|uniref:FecR family protein n=1 Tax=Pedobacter hiemivivus TaxID=2530454 RepID=A0A4U1G5G4_9SPHI|nr:FecR family protein [Pedobacter hiemivivus]TKC58574.1 FecR family protein [Pedobacter hiemivivus]
MKGSQLQDPFWIANHISGYLNSTLSPSEQDELFSWVAQDETNYAIFCAIVDEKQLLEDRKESAKFDMESAWQKVFPKLEDIRVLKPQTSYKTYIAIAASLFLCLGTLLYFQAQQQKSEQKYAIKNTGAKEDQDVYLTLANGKRISLTDAASGSLIEQEGVKISKTKEGQLLYQVTGTGSTVYNTLSVPKGQQYQVILPDGTRVWLNAASSLKYPSKFAGLKQRVVELTGEAYFQVKHDQKQPFLVKTAGQQVEDIGTEFNINAYDDEKVVETTLTEGAVKVTNQLGDTETISPGEQTLIAANQKIIVRKADVQKITAWKNGEFFFKGDDIQYILRQVSRWYNVDIVYLGNVPVSKFAGQASRNITLEQMMDILRESGIETTLTNRTLFVKDPQ